jgi:outer membrane usher protein
VEDSASSRARLAVALSALLAVSAPQLAVSAADEAGTARASYDLYLEVLINGQPTLTLVSFQKRPEGLFAQVRDLRELNIRTAGDPADWLALDTIRGLRYRIDEVHQAIDFTLSDEAREPYSVNGRHLPPPPARSDAGLLLNYDVFAQRVEGMGDPSLAMLSEQRYFGPLGFVTNSGVESIVTGEHRYTRQNTTYQYDDPESLRSYQVGDTITSALSWSRPVRLGGVSISRNFALQPELVTFPVPSLSGSAALPSTVDLYVNSVHQVSTSVPNGPFVINNIGAITGAGLATLVVRDAFGRTVTATLPMYIDSRLLAPGLSSFSVEAGALRYAFGSKSFDYEGHAAFDATLRSGLNDYLTLEMHGEASEDLEVLGGGALVRLGNAGVLNAAISVSNNSIAWNTRAIYAEQPSVPGAPAGELPAHLAQGRGAKVALGYQLVTPHFSVNLQSIHAITNYADLAALGGSPPPRFLDQIAVSVPIKGEHTLGASLIHVSDNTVGMSSLAGLWYSVRLSKRTSVFVNAARDFEQSRSASMSLGFSFSFGDRVSSYTNIGRNAGHGDSGTSISRGADYGGGWEWAAQADRIDNESTYLARLGYLGTYGELSAAVNRFAGRSALSVEGVGGLLLMDGVVEASRHIGGGFALVSTDGAAGVPVLHENRLIGTTDESGHLLVPDLNAYQHNHLSIDTLSLPPEDRIPVDHLDLSPRSDSGVLARFPIEHYRAATIVIVDVDGNVLPVGTEVHQLETNVDYIVGYDGQLFVDGLRDTNHLTANLITHSCSVEFQAPEPAKNRGSLRDLGKLTCKAEAGTP